MNVLRHVQRGLKQSLKWKDRVNMSSVIKVVHVVECRDGEEYSTMTLLPKFRARLLLAWGAISNARACRAMLTDCQWRPDSTLCQQSPRRRGTSKCFEKTAPGTGKQTQMTHIRVGRGDTSWLVWSATDFAAYGANLWESVWCFSIACSNVDNAENRK